MATARPDQQAADSSAASELLDPDDLFHSLQNERRRRVLRVLADAEDETFAMGEIAEFVAAAENECPERHVSSNQRKRVYIALYQNHLPQLDDVGLVEYDQNRGSVSAGPALEQAVTFLEMTAPADTRDGHDDVDELDAETESSETLHPSGDSIALGVSGSVAAVSLVAAGAVWAGVLGAASGLTVVLAIAVAAFALTVARC